MKRGQRQSEDAERIPEHLGDRDEEFYWDWSRENPVEIVLVAFILVLFFTVPRTGCGIDKEKGSYPTRSTSQPAQAVGSTDS